MRVVWSDRARLDLRNLVAYIAEDSVQAAELVADRILGTAKHLAMMPGSGRPGRTQETRECVVHKTPYILVYRIVSRQVRLLRIYHGARRWPSRFE